MTPNTTHHPLRFSMNAGNSFGQLHCQTFAPPASSTSHTTPFKDVHKKGAIISVGLDALRVSQLHFGTCGKKPSLSSSLLPLLPNGPFVFLLALGFLALSLIGNGSTPPQNLDCTTEKDLFSRLICGFNTRRGTQIVGSTYHLFRTMHLLPSHHLIFLPTLSLPQSPTYHKGK